jgi:hypothetical protein
MEDAPRGDLPTARKKLGMDEGEGNALPAPCAATTHTTTTTEEAEKGNSGSNKEYE